MWGLSNAVTGGIYSSLTAEASLIPIPRDMRTCCEIKRSQKFPSLCQVWGVGGGLYDILHLEMEFDSWCAFPLLLFGCCMCYFSFPKAQLYVGILYSTCGRSRETRRPLKVKKNQGRLRAMVDSLAGSPQRKKKKIRIVFLICRPNSHNWRGELSKTILHEPLLKLPGLTPNNLATTICFSIPPYFLIHVFSNQISSPDSFWLAGLWGAPNYL